MTAVTRYFFTPLYAPTSAWSVINWWESRRAIFNLWVGAAGLVALAAVNLLALLPPYPAIAAVPLGAIAVYAVLANLCYTAGSVVDLLIRRRWGNEYAAVGPALLRYGFVFSVGLTLLPIPLAFVGWMIRLLNFIA